MTHARQSQLINAQASTITLASVGDDSVVPRGCTCSDGGNPFVVSKQVYLVSDVKNIYGTNGINFRTLVDTCIKREHHY